MSDTPRVDEFCKTAGGQYTYDLSGLARHLERELAATIEQRDKALVFLHRYRNDTPLGHQPHMIAHDVDQFLKACAKLKEKNGG